MDGDLYTHAGAVLGGAAAAAAAVWGFMRRFMRGANAAAARSVEGQADSQALREVRAVDKKHTAKIEALDVRLQRVERESAETVGQLRQITNRLEDIWKVVSK